MSDTDSVTTHSPTTETSQYLTFTLKDVTYATRTSRPCRAPQGTCWA